MSEVNYIIHSSGPWKKHKYIKKVGNRYYYTEGLEAEAKLRELQRERKDLERTSKENKKHLLKMDRIRKESYLPEKVEDNTDRYYGRKGPKKFLDAKDRQPNTKYKEVPKYGFTDLIKDNWTVKVADPYKKFSLDKEIDWYKKNVEGMKNGKNFLSRSFLKTVNAGSKVVDKGKNFVNGLFKK